MSGNKNGQWKETLSWYLLETPIIPVIDCFPSLWMNEMKAKRQNYKAVFCFTAISCQIILTEPGKKDSVTAVALCRCGANTAEPGSSVSGRKNGIGLRCDSSWHSVKQGKSIYWTDCKIAFHFGTSTGTRIALNQSWVVEKQIFICCNVH